jgi:hypothetical protein
MVSLLESWKAISFFLTGLVTLFSAWLNLMVRCALLLLRSVHVWTSSRCPGHQHKSVGVFAKIPDEQYYL